MPAVTLILGSLIGVAIFAWFLFALVLPRRKRTYAINLIPGPPTVPLFGNCLDMVRPPEEAHAYMVYLDKKYWPIVRAWAFNTAVVTPLEPNLLEELLTSTQQIAKSDLYHVISDWLSEGLLTSKGAKWHQRRKLLTPAFHFKILEQFLQIFHKNAMNVVDKMAAHVDSDKSVDIVPLITLGTLDIICETAMGVSINAQQDSGSKYVEAIHEVNALMLRRFIRPWFHPGWIYRLFPEGRRANELISYLHNFTYKVIRERRLERNKERNGTTDKAKIENSTDKNEQDVVGTRKATVFLDLLLDISEKDATFTDKDIREEVDTFMFEGHDTTAMAMSWCLFFLGCNPEIQERCVEEIQSLLPDPEHVPTIAELSELKYLERVIKETMRLRPSVYIVTRMLGKPCKMGEYEVPTGTMVNIHIYSIHRNPHFYPEPDKFDPDRFLPHAVAGRHPYAFIPFSAGPRNCIGQKFAMLEMKSVLSSILRKFKLTTVDPVKSYVYTPDLLLRPKHGIHLKLQARQ